ncbi:hypothetical protein LMG27177_07385 [Paraburkholderia fynbosensis]|uniref:Uncharacterized protein n=1 Tax=Paraburkholderia fynbosensis TaxID=1200993 RepID=A0A6J5H1Z9_9BURK|nr:hypothetical protein LMG27177_07385 [Paraburkholderia fynbosensis]
MGKRLNEVTAMCGCPRTRHKVKPATVQTWRTQIDLTKAQTVAEPDALRRQIVERLISGDHYRTAEKPGIEPGLKKRSLRAGGGRVELAALRDHTQSGRCVSLRHKRAAF